MPKDAMRSEDEKSFAGLKRKSIGEPSGGKTQKLGVAPRISMNIGLKKPPVSAISMKLGASKTASSAVSGGTAAPAALKPKSSLAAAAFASDSEDEPEDMPPEAKMKMRNIGRDTPTSAGPNSFCKSKLGFCDNMKLADKLLLESVDQKDKPI